MSNFEEERWIKHGPRPDSFASAGGTVALMFRLFVVLPLAIVFAPALVPVLLLWWLWRSVTASARRREMLCRTREWEARQKQRDGKPTSLSSHGGGGGGERTNTRDSRRSAR